MTLPAPTKSSTTSFPWIQPPLTIWSRSSSAWSTTIHSWNCKKTFARNAVVGLARLGGYSVGIIAQQPNQLAGVIDIDAADKKSAVSCACATVSTCPW